MFPNVLRGRLTSLTFTEKTVYTDDDVMGIDVLRVRFIAPDGEEYHHDLPNGDYVLDNDALQFMAKWGYRPSMLLTDTHYDAYGDEKIVPIVYAGDTPESDCRYALAETAVKGGESLLSNASWFESANEDDGRERSHNGPNRNADDDDDNDDGGVVVKDGNNGQGINVHIS